MRLPTSDMEALVVLLEDLDAETGSAPFTPESLDRMSVFVGCEYASYELVDEADDADMEYVACSAENAMPVPSYDLGPCRHRIVEYHHEHAAEVVKLTDIYPLRRGRRNFDCPCCARGRRTGPPHS